MNLLRGVAAAAVVAALGFGGVVEAQAQAAPAQTPDVTINVGDRAPIFEGRSDDGTIWRSRDTVGKSILVVYFYPGAMTAGCTTQACLFRDNRSVLQELGAEVVGISGDRIEGL